MCDNTSRATPAWGGAGHSKSTLMSNPFYLHNTQDKDPAKITSGATIHLRFEIILSLLEPLLRGIGKNRTRERRLLTTVVKTYLPDDMVVVGNFRKPLLCWFLVDFKCPTSHYLRIPKVSGCLGANIRGSSIRILLECK